MRFVVACLLVWWEASVLAAVASRGPKVDPGAERSRPASAAWPKRLAARLAAIRPQALAHLAFLVAVVVVAALMAYLLVVSAVVAAWVLLWAWVLDWSLPAVALVCYSFGALLWLAYRRWSLTRVGVLSPVPGVDPVEVFRALTALPVLGTVGGPNLLGAARLSAAEGAALLGACALGGLIVAGTLAASVGVIAFERRASLSSYQDTRVVNGGLVLAVVTVGGQELLGAPAELVVIALLAFLWANRIREAPENELVKRRACDPFTPPFGRLALREALVQVTALLAAGLLWATWVGFAAG